MSMNFYSWIREGVRRAVLLGVSDAVEQLGAGEDQGELNQHLLAVLREAPQRPALVAAAAGGGTLAIESSAAAALLEADDEETAARRVQPLGAKRKRLGRSLSQVVDRPAGEEE